MESTRKITASNGEEIMLRPAREDDSCGILDTIRSRAPERSFVLMEQYGRNIASEQAYIKNLDQHKNLLLVAASGTEVIGCLGALQADSGMRESTAHILHIGLHLKEQYRGLGIGSHLLAYAAEWAMEKGFSKLEASIFTTNKRSLKLFLKSGFAEEGVRKQSIRMGKDFIDEVLMGKVLQG